MRAYDDSNDDSGSAYTPDHHPVEPPHAEPAPIHANELPDAHLNAAPEVDPHHTEAPIENNEVHYYPEVHAAPEPVHEQPAPEPHTDPVQHVDLAPIDNGITHAEVYTPAFSLAPPVHGEGAIVEPNIYVHNQYQAEAVEYDSQPIHAITHPEAITQAAPAHEAAPVVTHTESQASPSEHVDYSTFNLAHSIGVDPSNIHHSESGPGGGGGPDGMENPNDHSYEGYGGVDPGSDFNSFTSAPSGFDMNNSMGSAGTFGVTPHYDSHSEPVHTPPAEPAHEVAVAQQPAPAAHQPEETPQPDRGQSDGGNGGWAGVAGGGFYDGMDSSGDGNGGWVGGYVSGPDGLGGSYTTGGDFHMPGADNPDLYEPPHPTVVSAPEPAHPAATENHDAQQPVAYTGEPHSLDGTPSASDLSHMIDQASMAPADHIMDSHELMNSPVFGSDAPVDHGSSMPSHSNDAPTSEAQHSAPEVPVASHPVSEAAPADQHTGAVETGAQHSVPYSSEPASIGGHSVPSASEVSHLVEQASLYATTDYVSQTDSHGGITLPSGEYLQGGDLFNSREGAYPDPAHKWDVDPNALQAGGTHVFRGYNGDNAADIHQVLDHLFTTTQADTVEINGVKYTRSDYEGASIVPDSIAHAVEGSAVGTGLVNLANAGVGTLYAAGNVVSNGLDAMAHNSPSDLINKAIDGITPSGHSGEGMEPLGNPMGDATGFETQPDPHAQAPESHYASDIANAAGFIGHAAAGAVDALVVHPIAQGVDAAGKFVDHVMSPADAAGAAGHVALGVVTAIPLVGGAVKAVDAGAELINAAKAGEGLAEVANIDHAAVNVIEHAAPSGLYDANGNLIFASDDLVRAPGSTVHQIEHSGDSIVKEVHPHDMPTELEPAPSASVPLLGSEVEHAPVGAEAHLPNGVEAHTPTAIETHSPAVEAHAPVGTEAHDVIPVETHTPVGGEARAPTGVETHTPTVEAHAPTETPAAAPVEMPHLGDAPSNQALASVQRNIDNPINVSEQYNRVVNNLRESGIQVDILTRAQMRDLTGSGTAEAVSYLDEAGVPHIAINNSMTPTAKYESILHEVSHSTDDLNLLKNGGSSSIEFSSESGSMAIPNYESFGSVGEIKAHAVQFAAEKQIMGAYLAEGDYESAARVLGRMQETVETRAGFQTEIKESLPKLEAALENPATTVKIEDAALDNQRYVITIQDAAGLPKDVSFPGPAGLSQEEALHYIRNAVDEAKSSVAINDASLGKSIDEMNAFQHLIDTKSAAPTPVAPAAVVEAPVSNAEHGVASLIENDHRVVENVAVDSPANEAMHPMMAGDSVARESHAMDASVEQHASASVVVPEEIHPALSAQPAHASGSILETNEFRVAEAHPTVSSNGSFSQTSMEPVQVQPLNTVSQVPHASEVAHAPSVDHPVSSTPDSMGRVEPVMPSHNVLGSDSAHVSSMPTRVEPVLTATDSHVVTPVESNAVRVEPVFGAPDLHHASPVVSSMPGRIEPVYVAPENHVAATHASLHVMPEMTAVEKAQSQQMYHTQMAAVEMPAIRQVIPENVETVISLKSNHGVDHASGDFVGVYPGRDGEVHILVGDMAGQGHEAAQASLKLQQMMMDRTNQMILANGGLASLDKKLAANPSNNVHGSMSHIVLHPETGALKVSGAGDNVVLIAGRDGNVVEARRSDHMFGLDALSKGHKESSYQLKPEDHVIAMTDGVWESFNRASKSGLQVVRDVLGQARKEGLPTHEIVQRLQAHAGQTRADDHSVVALQWKPTAAKRAV